MQPPALPASPPAHPSKPHHPRCASRAPPPDEQAAPAAGGLGLRSSKSFGGHLAELMQQIAQEEFEELNGPQGDQQQQQHLEQVGGLSSAAGRPALQPPACLAFGWPA